jgi:hypothetical protein
MLIIVIFIEVQDIINYRFSLDSLSTNKLRVKQRNTVDEHLYAVIRTD